jgi:hypothetical protein
LTFPLFIAPTVLISFSRGLFPLCRFLAAHLCFGGGDFLLCDRDITEATGGIAAGAIEATGLGAELILIVTAH